MSTFEIKPYQVAVTDHPNADRLDLVQPIGTEYRCVSQKGLYEDGDYAYYVPEGAVVSEETLKYFGFWDEENGKGVLAGSNGDRVKAIKLRGALSQGLLFPLNKVYDYIGRDAIFHEGDDIADVVGITKYHPPIPSNMSGKVEHVVGLRGYTDIENIKKFPNALEEGELVVATEKIHGTCTIMSLINDNGFWEFHVTSKGQAQKGLALVESNLNLYWQMAKDYLIETTLRTIAAPLGAEQEITLFGETFGAGVQDLNYDREAKDFRAFDLRVDGKYVDYDMFEDVMHSQCVPIAPLSLRGRYSRAEIEELAATHSVVGGKLREGIVVKPVVEREIPELGRVVLKVINPKYLTRKNGTELE